MLIKKVILQSQVHVSNETNRKRKLMATTVISLTTMFLVCSFPQTFTRGFYLTQLSSTPAGITVIFASDTLAFSYHALNFFILYASNKKFSNEIKSFVRGMKSRSSDTTILGE